MAKTATWSHGTDLRDFREKRLGISQQAAATKVGVSLGAYSAWERGSAIPKLESLSVMVERLGVPPEIVGYEAPAGWELVPAQWLRETFAAQEERARVRHEELLSVLRAVRLGLRDD